jgi:hypothetical protein
MDVMKWNVRIVQVLDLDADSVELTCCSMISKKAGFNMASIIGGDMGHLREEMVASQPKVFKIVVDRGFYVKNNLNVGCMVNIEVSI